MTGRLTSAFSGRPRTGAADAGRSTDGGTGSAMKAVRTSSSRWWEAPNRAPAVRRREFAALGRLARHYAQRGSPWQVGAAGFEARVQLREPGLVGVAVYKVHLVGWEDSRARFHASVTVWPRATAVRRGRTTREASRAWCETCRLALARYGYRGEWRRGEWHFGDFWKRLKDMQALKAEVEALARWTASPPWSVSAVEQGVAAGEARRKRRGGPPCGSGLDEANPR